MGQNVFNSKFHTIDLLFAYKY